MTTTQNKKPDSKQQILAPNGKPAQSAPKEGEIVPFNQKVGTFRDMLENIRPQIEEVLPKHIDVSHLLRVAMGTIRQNPKLLDCTGISVMKSLMNCAILGLEPDGVLGHAYLVPFKDECTIIVGYKGLLKLARQSGEISTIEAHAVRVGDEFKYARGTNPFLKHVAQEAPLVEYKDEKNSKHPDPEWMPGYITHFYSVCKLKDGSTQFEVMQLWEVHKIRDSSQGYMTAMKYNRKDAPWIEHFEAMGCKTVLRRQCKVLPMSTTRDHLLARAVSMDEAGDAGLRQDNGVIDISSLQEPEKKSALDAVAANANAKDDQAGQPGAGT